MRGAPYAPPVDVILGQSEAETRGSSSGGDSR